MSQRMHTHYYMGETSYNDGHIHNYRGITSPSPNYPNHTHLLMGDTTVNDRHLHEYRISTNRQIETRDGHYHEYSGDTDYAQGHDHSMQGSTSDFSGNM